MAKQKEKTNLGKIWYFLWEDDSVLSWLADLILLWIIVKFIFFPFVGFLLATSLPSVIVESDSMLHQGNFDIWWRNYGDWYETHGITKEQAESWIFNNGFKKGDIMIVKGSRHGYNLSVGEVIIFEAGQPRPIIHRVIDASPLATKGDNNIEQLAIEKNIKEEQIVGKAIFRIPKAGWAKLIFVEIFKAISN